MKEIKSSKAARKLPTGTRVLIVSQHLGTIEDAADMKPYGINDSRIESASAGDYYFDERDIELARESGTRFYVIE